MWFVRIVLQRWVIYHIVMTVDEGKKVVVRKSVWELERMTI